MDAGYARNRRKLTYSEVFFGRRFDAKYLRHYNYNYLSQPRARLGEMHLSVTINSQFNLIAGVIVQCPVVPACRPVGGTTSVFSHTCQPRARLGETHLSVTINIQFNLIAGVIVQCVVKVI